MSQIFSSVFYYKVILDAVFVEQKRFLFHFSSLRRPRLSLNPPTAESPQSGPSDVSGLQPAADGRGGGGGTMTCNHGNQGQTGDVGQTKKRQMQSLSGPNVIKTR